MTDWQQAERLAAGYMLSAGFASIALTGNGADAGIDVTAIGAAAQVKAWAKPVPRPEIQRFMGAAIRSSVLLFFSSAGYTRGAREYADDVGIALFRLSDSGVTPENSAAQRIHTRAGLARPGSWGMEVPGARAAQGHASDGSAWASLFAALMVTSLIVYACVGLAPIVFLVGAEEHRRASRPDAAEDASSAEAKKLIGGGVCGSLLLGGFIATGVDNPPAGQQTSAIAVATGLGFAVLFLLLGFVLVTRGLLAQVNTGRALPFFDRLPGQARGLLRSTLGPARRRWWSR